MFLLGMAALEGYAFYGDLDFIPHFIMPYVTIAEAVGEPILWF